MTAVDLGFLPLCDAAPLIAAFEKGFFEAEGLQVRLSREPSWANVRDKLVAGLLDGAHLLAPLALAMAAEAGAAGEEPPVIAPVALNLNGAAVTLASRLARQLGRLEGSATSSAQRFKRVVAGRSASGQSPLRLAIVLPASVHSELLNAWLTMGGVDPERDVEISVLPPPRMVDHLTAGLIDGFCAGAPWNELAELHGVGVIALRADQVWPLCPDKVLGVRRCWALRQPDVLQRLLRALAKAAEWVEALENRTEIAAVLARPEYLAVDAAVILRGLEHIYFHRHQAGVPRLEHARWFAERMRRDGRLAAGIDPERLAAAVYRPDLRRRALLVA